MMPAKDLAAAINRRAMLVGRTVVRRLYISQSQEKQVVAQFERAYAASAPSASWMGAEVTVSPLDLWIYQEIVHETRPDLIIAVDTSSARYLADLCEIADRGCVLAIDAAPAALPATVGSPRIRCIASSSVDADTLRLAGEDAGLADAVLVVLGSRSAVDQLAEELRLYGPLVSPGSYLIVEETSVSRPRAAEVEAFVQRDPMFGPDRGREKLLLTGNAGGYLRRLR